MNYDFQKVFYPESIALVGASNNLYGSFLLSHLTGGAIPRGEHLPGLLPRGAHPRNAGLCRP